MSEKPIKQNKQDEVDLGLVFLYLENLVKKLFDLFKQLIVFLILILKKIGIFLLYTLNILKKHFIKVAAAGILTYVLFTVLDNYSSPIYQSNITINQNYETGKLIYGNISRYNLLTRLGDSVGLGRQLGISENKAAKLLGFEIHDNMNKNELLQEYYNYIVDLDSTLIIPFTEFSDQYDLENLSLQTIYVFAAEPDTYDGLADAIVSSFEKNKFFNEEKRRYMEFSNEKVKAYKDVLLESDTLQSQYVDLLKNYYGGTAKDDGSGTTTLNLSLSNTKEKIDTKEFQLFEEQNKVRLQLAELQKEINEKETILSLQNDFTPPIVLESIYSEYKKEAAAIVSLLVLLLFLFKEIGVVKFIEKHGIKQRFVED